MFLSEEGRAALFTAGVPWQRKYLSKLEHNTVRTAFAFAWQQLPLNDRKAKSQSGFLTTAASEGVWAPFASFLLKRHDFIDLIIQRSSSTYLANEWESVKNFRLKRHSPRMAGGCATFRQSPTICVLLGPHANRVLSVYPQWDCLDQVCKLRLAIPSSVCFPAWTSDSM